MIAVVVILAFVLNLLVLQDRDSTVLVAVAEEPVATGAPLDPSTLRLVPVDAGFEGLGDLITEEDLAAVEGMVFARSIPEGGLIDVTDIISPTSTNGLRSMSLPVAEEHAAGGGLVSGDRIDVISVVDGRASFVATDLEVIAASGSSAAVIGSTSSYHVVVSVEADEALALAEALDGGSVEIIRATGSEPVRQGNGNGA